MGYNMVMIIWGMVAWWYTDGWRQALERIEVRLEATLDFFSFDLLLKTLFAPFRQISAGSVRGSFDMQMRAFFDRLISRVIGMVVRLVMMGVGSVVMLINLLTAVVLIVGWMIVPLLPIVGLGLFVMGWLPWSN